MIDSLKKIYTKIRKKIELSKYDDFTIAEYFRKQGAQIGEFNRIIVRSLGTEPYLIKIGNHCTIAPNVEFITHDGGTWVFTEQFPDLQKFGIINILDNCFIGINVTIMPNVTIGPNSIIGAGSVVTKDIPPNVVAAGNPAKTISPIENYKEKVINEWEKQKPPSYFKETNKGIKYHPADIDRNKQKNLLLLKQHLMKYFWKNHNL